MTESEARSEYRDYAEINDARQSSIAPDFSERVREFRYRIEPWAPADRSAAILDVACGRGECLAALNSLGFKNVVGCDISESQIAHARKRLEQASLWQGSFQDFLVGKQGLFDLVIASHVLEHMDRERLMEAMALFRVSLVPGGRLLVLVPNAATPAKIIYAYSDITHRLFFSGMSLAQVGYMNGFTAEYLGGVKPEKRGTRGHLRALLWTMVSPLLRTLSGDKRMKFGSIVEPELIAIFRVAGKRGG